MYCPRNVFLIKRIIICRTYCITKYHNYIASINIAYHIKYTVYSQRISKYSEDPTKSLSINI